MKEKIQIKYNHATESRTLHDGVFSIDSNSHQLHIHDGVTPNGLPIPTADSMGLKADVTFDNVSATNLIAMFARIAGLQGYDTTLLTPAAQQNMLNKLGISSLKDNIGQFCYSLRTPAFDGLNPVMGVWLYADGHSQSCVGFNDLQAVLKAGELPMVTTVADWNAKTDAYGNNGYFMYDEVNQQIMVPKVVDFCAFAKPSGSAKVGDSFNQEFPAHKHYLAKNMDARGGDRNQDSTLIAGVDFPGGHYMTYNLVGQQNIGEANTFPSSSPVVYPANTTHGQRNHSNGIYTNVFINVGARVRSD